MIYLILSVCFATAPLDCHDEPRSRDDGQPLTMTGCMMSGPMAGAEFTKENPEFTVRGWRCQIGKRERT